MLVTEFVLCMKWMHNVEVCLGVIIDGTTKRISVTHSVVGLHYKTASKFNFGLIIWNVYHMTKYRSEIINFEVEICSYRGAAEASTLSGMWQHVVGWVTSQKFLILNFKVSSKLNETKRCGIRTRPSSLFRTELFKICYRPEVKRFWTQLPTWVSEPMICM